MNGFNFVHTADIHLDSKFKGIADMDESIGKALADATFTSFFNMIEYCIEKQVDFLVIAGDIYDEEDKSLRSQLKFLEGMEKLHKNNIQVYIVHGNHDSLNGWSAKLKYPPNVYVFGGKKVARTEFQKREIPVAQIYGISFLKRDTEENLANKFPKKEKSENLFTIGLLHCNVAGNGVIDCYSPCALADLTAHDYDYWALGHIHARRVLHKDPMVVYPGNPQGLNPKETGEKGFIHVFVEDTGTIDSKFVASDSIRWVIEEISIQAFQNEQDLIDEFYDRISHLRSQADERPTICRFVLKDSGEIYSILAKPGFLEDLIGELRQNEADETSFVWTESIINNTSISIDRESQKKQKGFISDLLELFDELKTNEEKKAALTEEIDLLFSSPSGRKFLEPLAESEIMELLQKAESFCLSKLPIGLPSEDAQEESI